MLKEKTFRSSIEYTVELYDYHFTELQLQHNDNNRIESIACNLICNAISRFIQDSNYFTLVYDDLRLENIV